MIVEYMFIIEEYLHRLEKRVNKLALDGYFLMQLLYINGYWTAIMERIVEDADIYA